MNQALIKDRNRFIEAYSKATNAATGSAVDANANITQKTLASLESELYKPLTIAINRERVTSYMTDALKEKYLSDLESHLIYTNDETSLKPYCASISLYPFLLEGTKCIGGVSGAPKSLQSFCGSFVNFIYQVASNFAGAVATVEYLHYFDYFARKTYGKDYMKYYGLQVIQEMQGVIYAMNQPASARGDQAVFWNISVFDKPYFDAMFGEFFYPDGTQPDYESVRRLQDVFMYWFREERKKELLTFPVVTASHLIDKETKEYKDQTFLEARCNDMANGLSFFVYVSDSADSLASCCRLRNELADNTFSYSLGAGGVVTGSAQVITLNLNRAVQYYGVDNLDVVIEDIQRYLVAHRDMYKHYIDSGLLPVYTAGIMDLDKQFLTIGLNGIVEAAEFCGLTAGDNEEYREFLKTILKICSDANKQALKDTGIRFNTEFVPAENLGVKFAQWDKEAGLNPNSEVYNSYFYRPEDSSVSIVDKFSLFGNDITQHLDGGSALHLNLGHIMTFKQAVSLYNLAAKHGVPYWTFNVLSTCCNRCGHIDPETYASCPKCESTDIDYATRIIGYLKRISNFSKDRQVEAGLRKYHKQEG